MCVYTNIIELKCCWLLRSWGVINPFIYIYRHSINYWPVAVVDKAAINEWKEIYNEDVLALTRAGYG